MELPTCLDHKQYLRELISSYESILSNPDSPLQILHTFILEEKYKCEYQLHRINEIDIEALLTANASVCLFPHTKHI